MIHACSVATSSCLTEFLLLKLTLESYHDVSWTVSCDPEAADFLSKYKNVRVLRNIDTDNGCSHGTNDSSKTKKFTDLMMKKFSSVDDSIDRNGYGLFLDADIFFTNEIDPKVLNLINNVDVDVILSPHMTNNLTLESNVGHYNGGMFCSRSKKFTRQVVDLSSNPNNGLYLDQQAMQFAAYEHTIVGLPINYNIGWWRFNENFTKQRLELIATDGKNILFNGNKAVCFHVHTLKKLDYENYGKFLVDKVLNLMRNTENSNYKIILEHIEKLSIA